MILKSIFEFLEVRPGRTAFLMLASAIISFRLVLVLLSYVSASPILTAFNGAPLGLIAILLLYVPFFFMTLFGLFFRRVIGMRKWDLEEYYLRLKKSLGIRNDRP